MEVKGRGRGGERRKGGRGSSHLFRRGTKREKVCRLEDQLASEEEGGGLGADRACLVTDQVSRP